MIPTLFEIPIPGLDFSIPIHSFGLSLVLAFIGAWKLLEVRLRRFDQEPELAEKMTTWAAVGGIVGARLFYVLSFPETLMSDPLGAIFGGAGFIFYGGFIGGAFAVWLLLYLNGKPFRLFGDIAAPSLAVGYAIGRIGCQLSGDGDYGAVSDLPWALSYRLGVVPTPAGVTVHPAPVYESLLASGILLLLCSRRVEGLLPRCGQLFGLYLCLSALERFFIEIVRIEPKVFAGFTQAQIVAAGILLTGAFFVVSARGRREAAATTP